MIDISTKDDIDAFFQCYKNAKATLSCIDSFFQVYNNGTIYLHSDNGYDYSKLINKYPNIVYYHHEYRTGTWEMELPQSIEWARRLFSTVQESDKKYLIILEDDVRINNRVCIKNDANMVSGPNMTAFFNNSIFDHIQQYDKLKNNINKVYSGAGGCIFEANIIRNQLYSDIVDMVEYFCLKHKFYSDQILSLMIYLGNGFLGFDPYHGRNLIDNDVCHSWDIKKFYKEPLTEDEQLLISCTDKKDIWSFVFNTNHKKYD